VQIATLVREFGWKQLVKPSKREYIRTRRNKIAIEGLVFLALDGRGCLERFQERQRG
jgi:hypothetical protein